MASPEPGTQAGQEISRPSFRQALQFYRKPPIREPLFWIVQLATVAIFGLTELLRQVESSNHPLVPPGAVVVLDAIPVLIAALNFGLYGSAITALVATVLVAVALGQDITSHDPLDAWAQGAQMVIVDVVGTIVGHFQEVVTRARQEIVAYAARIVDSQEEERRRIARELHDEPLQMLVQLSRILESHDPGSAELGGEQRFQAVEITRAVMASLRATAEGLRPLLLEDLGLVAALRRLARDASEQSSATVEYTVTGEEGEIAPEIELAFFRIAQEGITNALRHSGASRVRLRLHFAPGELALAVEDNGKGIDHRGGSESLGSGVRSLGITGMKERAHSIGASFAVGPSSEAGTLIELRSPIPPGSS